MPNSEPSPAPGMTAAAESPRIGRYELLHAIGRGAEAVVYRALDPVIGRQVALKVMPLVGEDRRNRDARLREVRAVGKLKHPNIVTVHDAGESNGVFYIAFELVEGVTVEQVLAGGVRFPWQRAASIVAALADALEHAHRCGVIHRDLKPSNVMLAGDGRVLLTDFGVARVADAQLTTDGHVVGTPAFMAPEYLTGRSGPTPRCDLFSLVAVFYELLTGDRPFLGDTIYEVTKAIVEGPTPDPAAVVPELPPSLCALVRRGLAHDPEERPADARQLEAELRVLLAGAEPAPDQDETDWTGLVSELAIELDRLGAEATAPIPTPVGERSSGVVAGEPAELPPDAPGRLASLAAWPLAPPARALLGGVAAVALLLLALGWSLLDRTAAEPSREAAEEDVVAAIRPVESAADESPRLRPEGARERHPTSLREEGVGRGPVSSGTGSPADAAVVGPIGAPNRRPGPWSGESPRSDDAHLPRDRSGVDRSGSVGEPADPGVSGPGDAEPVVLDVHLLSNAARGRLVVEVERRRVLAQEFDFEREGWLRRRVDGHGRYSLSLPPGRHRLEISIDRSGGRVQRAGLEAEISPSGAELWVRLDRRDGVVAWVESSPPEGEAVTAEHRAP